MSWSPHRGAGPSDDRCRHLTDAADLLVIGRTRVNGLVYGSYVRLQRGLWADKGLVLASCVRDENAIGGDKTADYGADGAG